MHLIRPARLRDERGFSMIVVMVVLLASGLFVAGAFATANGDLPYSLDSRDRKTSYAAAEAGLNLYKSRLTVDNDYWTRCANVPGTPNPVNLASAATAESLRWRTLPGSTARYTIELLPAPGKPNCVENDNLSMVDPATSTFRVRATGQARPGDGNRRSIVATFRRTGFLDYLYFTDYETTDPFSYPPSSRTTAQIEAACGDKYRAERAGGSCREIQFSGTDEIRGPFHTNDDILTCGSPVFGRNAGDVIEMFGPGSPAGEGYRAVCSGTPNWRGQRIPQSKVTKLPLPTTNTELRQEAGTDYLFTGRTTIRLNGATMDVTTALDGLTRTMSLPANGVVFVRNDPSQCAVTRPAPPLADYAEPPGCAIVNVRGTYAKSLTIASESDVVVDGDVLRGNNASLLGLIAQDFVRVAHPVNRAYEGGDFDTCKEVQTAPQPRRIDAAILTLQHSFTVDNHLCGTDRGVLTVNGAIAQKYRGPVGTTGGTGYDKNYHYDDRLRFRSPPHFLGPVESAWKVVRVNEQLPAR